MPGVGFTLGVVILTAVGDVRRFPDAEHLATYAGTTPRIHSSGGKTRFGRTRPDVNHYLKWAFREAAEACCQHRESDRIGSTGTSVDSMRGCATAKIMPEQLAPLPGI